MLRRREEERKGDAMRGKGRERTIILLVLQAQVSIPLDIISVGTSYQRVEVEVHVPHVKNAVQRAYACQEAKVAWFRWLSDEMSRESRGIRDDLVVESTR